MLETVNDALRLNFEGSQFCTVALGVVERDAHSARVTLTLGGHPAPLILRADGRVDTAGLPGSLLGVLQNPDLRECEARMEPGDTLLLFTDGAIETKTKRGRIETEGLERILGRCAGLNAMQIVTKVENEISLRREGEEPDDLALLAMRFAGAS
jgi:serine phosphatase RsbU (regulator of sigma subunit)